MSYRSITHTTSNEAGFEEVKIEEYIGTINRLYLMVTNLSFNVPKTKTRQYIKLRSGSWLNKQTYQYVDDAHQAIINVIVAEVKNPDFKTRFTN